MSEKERQHIVPATFLRQFEIQKYKYPNHVWCIDFRDKYLKSPVARGINSKIFTIKNFYTINNLMNKLVLENFYSNQIEPEYNKILDEVNSELNLSEKIRIRLIEWIFHSNQRTEHYRRNIKRISKWLIEMNFRFKNLEDKNTAEKELSINKDYIEKESIKIAKEIQIESIIDDSSFEEMIKLFIDELKTKKWIIYKSENNYPFIANDNPGFSLNISELNKEQIFNSTIQLNHPSFNYLVLSPKYCLYMEPFKQNDPISFNAFNIEIEYNKISKRQIDFINLGTYETSMRYLISNDLKTINRWFP